MATTAPPEDTSQVPVSPDAGAGRRRWRTRDVAAAFAVAAILLLLVEGGQIRHSGESMSHGPWRVIVLAVGKPSGWLADRLPLASANDRLRSWLSPDADGGDGGGETKLAVAARRGSVAAVTPDAFVPSSVGDRAAAPPAGLHTLLVTGDSMSQPLDTELARRLADVGVRTDRQPELGTGLSKTALLDWTAFAPQQVAKVKPDAEVVFIGANEGFPMPVPGGRTVNCCGAAWSAEYATRVRIMMNAYRRSGAARVYWLLLPLPRSGPRAKIAESVNAAVRVAAAPYAAQVRVLDMAALFTPGGKYRDAMDVGGTDTIVRRPDGIHLNDAGAKLAADAVQRALAADFGPKY